MLEHLFGSKTRVKLLQIFFRHPSKPFFGRELARLSGTQLNAVRREILNLFTLHLIQAVDAKNVPDTDLGTERSKYYQLNILSPLYQELKALLVQAAVIEEEEFVATVKARAGKVVLMVLTGVFTEADEVDTDLLIVGQVKPLVLTKLIKKFEKDNGRQIRYTIMSAKEFQERREIGDKFLYRIFEAKHLVAVDEMRVF
ncbi:MAG: hypothetical protein Q7K39_00775 [Candidatus Magasanikbacteria bacterium]|nr:hypothetical protein [Candidatus Magasanikbacteria bacterium]